MNLILHQFKTDLRHFRWQLLCLWLAFAVETALSAAHSLSVMGVGMMYLLLTLWEAILVLTLVASLIQADALVGTSAAWLTRPVRRAHLFWSKSGFILLCLFAPRLGSQCLAWAWRGYSFHLGLAAAAESLLLCSAFVLLVAVLAALTRDLGRFFLAAGITIGGIFASSATVEMLVHAGGLHRTYLNNEDGGQASAQTVGWLVLAAAGMFAWYWQARRGGWRTAALALATGLLAFPFITTVWSKNFLGYKLLPTAPLTLTLLDTNRPAAGETRGQVLSQELVVSGVPDRQIAVIQNLSAGIRFQNDYQTTWLPKMGPPYAGRRTRPRESEQKNNYFELIEQFFPSNTIWFNDNFNYGTSTAFYDEKIYKRFPQGPPPGTVDGSAMVDLFAVKKVAESPLRAATFPVLPGLRVTIQNVQLVNGAIRLELDECRAQLLFNRDVDTSDPQNYGEPYCTYVLYHPGSGEAFVVSQHNAQQYFPPLMSGEAHQSLQLRFPYPALRECLAGVTATDWLHEARLCVFAPAYAGTTALTFHSNHYYMPVTYDGNLRRQKEKAADTQTIANATLPENPTDAQRDAYLDEILPNIPVNLDSALRKSITSKLTALGTNGMPALLRRLPLAQNVENTVVFPVIKKLATRDQLPELCAALQRDNNATGLFLGKPWEEEARAVLVAKLPDHREPLSPESLRIVAGAKDPATYADLYWHFVHLQYGQPQVIKALKECPGFDTAAAVREAWHNARLGIVSTDDLATPAAAQGLPEALNLAIIHVESLDDLKSQQRALAPLAALTGYTGPTNLTLPWLTANIAHFQYDEVQQRYLLAPTH